MSDNFINKHLPPRHLGPAPVHQEGIGPDHPNFHQIVKAIDGNLSSPHFALAPAKTQKPGLCVDAMSRACSRPRNPRRRPVSAWQERHTSTAPDLLLDSTIV